MISASRLPRAGRGLVLPLLGALVLLAWIAIWVWGRSPDARFLHHAQAATSPTLRFASLFVVGWLVMIVAMMLPTTYALVAMFERMVRPRPDHRSLVALLVLGYLCTWTIFGAVAYVGDIGVHAAVAHVDWLASHPWSIGAATLIGAGAFQFSKLKYRCLDKCRSPFSFIVSHWTGRHERAEALRLGIDHGLFCIGCCWALMLVMFAVGVGQLAVMFVLGAVMSVEKNHPSGRRFTKPVGFALLAWGILHAVLSTA